MNLQKKTWTSGLAVGYAPAECPCESNVCILSRNLRRCHVNALHLHRELTTEVGSLRRRLA